MTEARSSPTTWWRSVAATNFHQMALNAMQASIVKVEMLGEPRWQSAIAGDAASAIGIALSMRRRDSFRQNFDLTMTALVLCACAGNSAACIVLANIIRRLPNAGRREARLATSWTLLAFRPLLAKERSGSTP